MPLVQNHYFRNARVTPYPPHARQNHEQKIWTNYDPQMLQSKADSTVLGPYVCSYLCLLCGGWGFTLDPLWGDFQPMTKNPFLTHFSLLRQIKILTCFHALLFSLLLPLLATPFCPFSPHLMAFFSPSKKVLCSVEQRARHTSWRGNFRMDLSTKFGKEIPSRNLREKRSVLNCFTILAPRDLRLIMIVRGEHWTGHQTKASTKKCPKNCPPKNVRKLCVCVCSDIFFGLFFGHCFRHFFDVGRHSLFLGCPTILQVTTL